MYQISTQGSSKLIIIMIPPMSMNYAHLPVAKKEGTFVPPDASRSYHVRRTYEQAW